MQTIEVNAFFPSPDSKVEAANAGRKLPFANTDGNSGEIVEESRSFENVLGSQLAKFGEGNEVETPIGGNHFSSDLMPNVDSQQSSDAKNYQALRHTEGELPIPETVPQTEFGREFFVQQEASAVGRSTVPVDLASSSHSLTSKSTQALSLGNGATDSDESNVRQTGLGIAKRRSALPLADVSLDNNNRVMAGTEGKSSAALASSVGSITSATEQLGADDFSPNKVNSDYLPLPGKTNAATDLSTSPSIASLSLKTNEAAKPGINSSDVDALEIHGTSSRLSEPVTIIGEKSQISNESGQLFATNSQQANELNSGSNRNTHDSGNYSFPQGKFFGSENRPVDSVNEAIELKTNFLSRDELKSPGPPASEQLPVDGRYTEDNSPIRQLASSQPSPVGNPVPGPRSNKLIQGDHLLGPTRHIETGNTKTIQIGDTSTESDLISSTVETETKENPTKASFVGDAQHQSATDTSLKNPTAVASEFDPSMTQRDVNQFQQHDIGLPNSSSEALPGKLEPIALRDQARAPATFGATNVQTSVKVDGNPSDPFGIARQIEVVAVPALENQLNKSTEPVRVQLQLDPTNLGQLHVEMTSDESTIKVQIVAEKWIAHSIIEQNVDNLIESLSGNGSNSVEVQLDHRGASESSDFDQPDSQPLDLAEGAERLGTEDEPSTEAGSKANGLNMVV